MAREDRDLTRAYTRTPFVARLRRLADAQEGERNELEFQLIWCED